MTRVDTVVFENAGPWARVSACGLWAIAKVLLDGQATYELWHKAATRGWRVSGVYDSFDDARNAAQVRG